jgi:D-beta-D-heptose 7-phosphate kinase/D-beta-D-heptose 1-phosphate adenosyltransferase
VRGEGFALDAGLLKEREAWRLLGRRLVVTNGCFDLIHSGHIALLEAARAAGDLLIVAVNGDQSVRALKGAPRPLMPVAERAEMLLALEAVDRVVIFREPTPLLVVQKLQPDVLVKGADWGPGQIVGADLVTAAGGRVLRVELVAGRSTSAIVERIRRS